MFEAPGWTEADVLALISSGVKESITLDYKRSGALMYKTESEKERRKTELSKDVSAFANSAGGVLLYGVEEDKRMPIGIDGGLDASVVTKEWIEQVINSLIHARIDGVVIEQIELVSCNPGSVIYAIHVPQSARAPHMAADHRYYKRFNFESVPMEDYEIRDVLRRSEAPDLSLQIERPLVPIQPDLNLKQSRPVAIPLWVSNSTASPAEHVVINLYVDERLSWYNQGLFFRLRTHGVLYWQQEGTRSRPAFSLQRERGMGDTPIWEGTSFEVNDPNPPLDFIFPLEPDSFVMAWSLKAPGMPAKRQTLALDSDGSQVQVREVNSTFTFRTSSNLLTF